MEKNKKEKIVVYWNDDEAAVAMDSGDVWLPTLTGYVQEVFYSYKDADDFIQKKFNLSIDEL